MSIDRKPNEVFYFFLFSGLLLMFIMIIVPDSGLTIFGVKVHFARVSDFLPQFVTDNTDEVSHNIIQRDAVDSVSSMDSTLRHVRHFSRKILNYRGEISPLASFYELKFSKSSKKVRIFHFGDSQIENDRISSLLRERWQSVLGGGGMGYLPANAWIPHLSAEHRNSDNWTRYTAFGRSHGDVSHRRFGPYQSFARFTPYDTTLCTEMRHAWIEVSASKRGYSKTRLYSKVKIFLGNNAHPFELSVSENGQNSKRMVIPALPDDDTLISIPLSEQGSVVRLDFSAIHSPDVYGISLESTEGLVLDNVPMRGADGTSFSRSDVQQISRYLRRENTALIIMQYGGNALPYLRDREHAGKAARNIARQVQLLSKISDGAPILFIGPSDMAIKVKDKFVSHPLLSDFRDSLMHHITQAGAAYYDLLEAMGGEGSMVEWVRADPPLASTDYVHFTPAGARKAAEKLFETLEQDKADYFKKHYKQSDKQSLQHDSAELSKSL